MPASVRETEKVEKVISTFQVAKNFKSVGVHYTSIDFDDSGGLALLARTDDTVQIFDTKKGAQGKNLVSAKYGCALARFTHDTRFVVYASTHAPKDEPNISPIKKHALRHHDIQAKTYLHYHQGHTDRVTSLSISPGDTTMVSASLDNTVKIWDLRSSNPQGSLNLFGATLTAYDPSATVLAVASPATQSVLLYDFKNFDKPPFATFDLLQIESGYRDKQVPGIWTSLEFSNNGKYILIGTAGAGHYLLDAFDGILKAFLLRPAGPPPFPQEVNAKDGAEDHPSASLQGGCTFSPDGRYVISTHQGTGLVTWDTTQCEGEGLGNEDKVLRPAFALQSSQVATVVGYSPKNNVLVSAGSGVLLWLPETEAQ